MALCVAAEAGAQPTESVPASEESPTPAEPPSAGAPTEAAPARAETQPTPATVTVRFHMEGGDTALSVPGAATDSTVGACHGTCTLELTPGKHRLYLSSGGERESLDLTVTGPSEVVVDGGSQGQRQLGLIAMIAGGTATAIGTFAVYYDLENDRWDGTPRDWDPGSRYRRPDWVLPLAIGGAVGLGVALVGVVVFVTAGPSAEVKPLESADAALRSTRASRPALVLKPEVGPSGGRLSLGGSF